MADLGPTSGDVYRAARGRIRARLEHLREDEEDIEADEVDWAVIRVLVPVLLRHHHDQDFQTITGFDFDDVRSLRDLATAQIREFASSTDFLTHQHGSCVVRLPTVRVATNVRLVGVPDEGSWDRVMPACARGRRKEFLSAFREHYRPRTEWRWEELTADSIEDMERWLKRER